MGDGSVRKIIIFTVLFLLVACGKVHENIDDGMVKDTNDIIDIIENTIKKDRDFTDREENKLNSYIVKYGAFKNDGRLTEEEGRLFNLAEQLIDNYDYYAYLDSDDEYFEDSVRYINNVIETGSMFKER